MAYTCRVFWLEKLVASTRISCWGKHGVGEPINAYTFAISVTASIRPLCVSFAFAIRRQCRFRQLLVPVLYNRQESYQRIWLQNESREVCTRAITPQLLHRLQSPSAHSTPLSLGTWQTAVRYWRLWLSWTTKTVVCFEGQRDLSCLQGEWLSIRGMP
jgi:hypothetical protein